jgi:hypothetical protein
MALHHPSLFAVMILLLPVSSMSADDSIKQIFSKVTGCYELSAMKWEPNPGRDILFLTVPKRIWLTYARAFREGTFLLLPAPGQPQSVHNVTYWEIDPKEGIRLVWSAGPVQIGLRIILQPPPERGKPMRGFAKVGFDTPTEYKDVPVIATKVSCGDHVEE